MSSGSMRTSVRRHLTTCLRPSSQRGDPTSDGLSRIKRECMLATATALIAPPSTRCAIGQKRRPPSRLSSTTMVSWSSAHRSASMTSWPWCYGQRRISSRTAEAHISNVNARKAGPPAGRDSVSCKKKICTIVVLELFLNHRRDGEAARSKGRRRPVGLYVGKSSLRGAHRQSDPVPQAHFWITSLRSR
jgi:hypothetical protein